jgi:hypothetical protein
LFFRFPSDNPFFKGKDMKSRASGFDSRVMSAALDATSRVIGPVTRPMIGRIDRHAAEAGLERENAAVRGGQAHRAADVGAQVQRA